MCDNEIERPDSNGNNPRRANRRGEKEERNKRRPMLQPEIEGTHEIPRNT